MSLGGVRDEAELRGHRRTYIGAMPGRIIQSIRRAGVNNPVMMLDEIDKLGNDYRGDPAAALLEILDPQQNNSFRDHYLDLPFDLSKVFFIATANQLGPIPAPLRDRMEIIRLAGYSDREKLEIAKRYLVPRQTTENGLNAAQFKITDAAIELIATRYTREAGVRQLERNIGSVARKVALKVAQGEAETVEVDENNIREYLGPPQFYPEQARKELPAGVATGMAWTEMGGEVLFIEATLLPGGRGLTITGQLGEVMQESARAAQSYLWSHADGVRHRSRDLQGLRRSPARSRGSDSEGRAERGRDDHFGAGVALHGPPRTAGHGDDRRDHAVRFGVSDWWHEGESAGRTSRGDPASFAAQPKRSRHRMIFRRTLETTCSSFSFRRSAK